MNIPSIPAIEGASELLDLLNNSPVLKKRMEDMMALSELINQRLRRYQDFETVEIFQRQADARTAKAKTDKEEADEYAKQKRKEVDDLLIDANREAARIGSDLSSRQQAVEHLARVTKQKEAMLVALQTDLQKLKADLDKQGALAKQTMGDAINLRDDFSSRMEKLREIARI